MDVAVAEMAEGVDPACPGSAPRPPRPRSVDEAGHRLDRDRNVVLGGRAVLLLGLRDAVAQPPEALGLRLAGGDRRVVDEAGLQRRAQALVEQFLRARRRHRRDRLDQHVPGRRRGERRPRARDMGEDEIERALRHQLEAFDRLAQRRFEVAQQRHRRGRRCDARPRPTARSPIAGTSFRLAAVTMPSVPSAPISNCLRS